MVWRRHVYSNFDYSKRAVFNNTWKAEEPSSKRRGCCAPCRQKLWLQRWQHKDLSSILQMHLRPVRICRVTTELNRVTWEELHIAMSWDFLFQDITQHQLQMCMPFTPAPRHQVGKPTSFHQCKSSFSRNLHQDQNRSSEPVSTLMPGSNARFLRNSSYPCILKRKSLSLALEIGA